MKKAIVFLVVALAIPTSVAFAKATRTHGKSNPRVMYVLKGTLSSYQAATPTVDGSISITVNHSNYHGRLLKDQTLTFSTTIERRRSSTRMARRRSVMAPRESSSSRLRCTGRATRPWWRR